MDANALLRSIYGFSRTDTQPLVYAVEVARRLMFDECRSRGSIQLMRDIYTPVAGYYERKKYSSVVRQLERLCNDCWDRLQKNERLLQRLVGTHNQDIEGPSDVIFLLACYLNYERPFQEVLELEPALTF